MYVAVEEHSSGDYENSHPEESIINYPLPPCLLPRPARPGLAGLLPRLGSDRHLPVLREGRRGRLALSGLVQTLLCCPNSDAGMRSPRRAGAANARRRGKERRGVGPCQGLRTAGVGIGDRATEALRATGRHGGYRESDNATVPVGPPMVQSAA